MTMTQERLDELVATYADLDARVTKLREDMTSILVEIRDGREPGTYNAAGLKVTVREPNRSFNLDKAVGYLPEALRPECKLDGYDAKKVRAFLAPVVADMCMDAGKGDRVVTIK